MTSGDIDVLWRIIASAPTRPIHVNKLGETWREALSSALLSQGSEVSIVVVDRPIGLIVRRARAWRSLKRCRASSRVSIRAVRSLLKTHGSIDATYDLWPSASDPSTAYPRSDHRIRRWIHRSGVAGVGGRIHAARMIARSPLMAPVFRVLTPAIGFVVRREDRLAGDV